MEDSMSFVKSGEQGDVNLTADVRCFFLQESIS